MRGLGTCFSIILTALGLWGSATFSANAQGLEIPVDERVLMRSYAQWWLSYTNKEGQERAYEIADQAFQRGNYRIAVRRYRQQAKYGDKFAQFRLGLIALEKDQPADAWAWFELANEGNTEPAFAAYPEQVWAELDAPGRERARTLRAERFPVYGDFAVAQRMKAIFSREKRSTTGSRTGYVGFLERSDGIDPDLFAATLSNGLTFSTAFTERYGTVRIGELKVIETGEAGEQEQEQENPPD